MNTGYLPPPQFMPNEVEHRRQLAQAITTTQQGKLNAVTNVTLTASATSTTLTDTRIGASTFIELMPTTATAATAKASVYITSRQSGSAIINHASATAVDQTFSVLMIG